MSTLRAAVGVVTGGTGVLVVATSLVHTVAPGLRLPVLNPAKTLPPISALYPSTRDTNLEKFLQRYRDGSAQLDALSKSLDEHLHPAAVDKAGKPEHSNTGGSPATPAVPKLTPGRILFEPTRTMQVKRPEVVIVRLDTGSSDIYSGLDPKRFTLDSVNVAPRMRVHLAGDPPDAFDVTAVEPPDEQQAVTSLAASTWTWNVLPKRDGESKLVLYIWALADVEGKDTLVPLLQKTETIQVHALPLPIDREEFWDKMIGKIAEKTGEGIAMLIGAALTAFGAWIWHFRGKPKTENRAWETP
ncbi:MAG TPA: hypothetical protein VKX45_07165 [Bryobacteraceae bacterium]|nr:hypothetical protein [Bryobacteraceae bacterium]